MGIEVKSIDVKKPQQVAAMERYSISKAVGRFIADIKTEIQKITWTSREELLVYTKIVVIATFVFGMAIYSLDLIIQGALNLLSFLLHLVSRSG
jgi:preprotein translocase subunit SecE